MNLVLLPHHNTLTCLQKLQQTAIQDTNGQGGLFLPAYPIVCVAGSLEEKALKAGAAPDDRQLRLMIDSLKKAMNGTKGICRFEALSAIPDGNGVFSIELPLSIPFADRLQEAGFIPESRLRFVLGKWEYASEQTSGSTAETLSAVLQTAIPPDFRAFRLALMQTTPLLCNDTLSEAQQPSAFTWKFIRPFWVKLC